jgi:hypothetical protein
MHDELEKKEVAVDYLKEKYTVLCQHLSKGCGETVVNLPGICRSV